MPIINLCKKHKWYFIFNLKPDRLKQVNETFEGNIKCHNEVNIRNYYLSTNIEFNKNLLNAFGIIDKSNILLTSIKNQSSLLELKKSIANFIK